MTRRSPAETGLQTTGPGGEVSTPKGITPCDTGEVGFYATSRVRRARATRVEMDARRGALVDLAHEHGPASVRHLFYAAVVAGVPGITKSQSGYLKVQRLVLELRREGLIPYESIVDNTRWIRKQRSYGTWQDAVRETARLYRQDLWATSPYRLEVWCESDSIAGVITPASYEWDVPLMVCRGHASETFAYSAAAAWNEGCQRPVVLYVGDHDPAGLDIEMSLKQRLGTFYCDGIEGITWRRIGITAGQVELLDLPTTPAKKARRRKPYPWDWSAEAEALPARMLRDLLTAAIEEYVDQEELAVLRVAEESERRSLFDLARGVAR